MGEKSTGSETVRVKKKRKENTNTPHKQLMQHLLRNVKTQACIFTIVFIYLLYINILYILYTYLLKFLIFLEFKTLFTTGIIFFTHIEIFPLHLTQSV